MNKLYRRALPTLLLALASPLFGCGAAKDEAAVPTSEVKLAASEPPSRFAALGVKATLTPPSAESERWLRELDGALAACLKPALEREPWLQGRMTFALEPTSPSEPASTSKATSVGGELANHAAVSCLQQAFTQTKTTTREAGALKLELAFEGGYEAAALGAEPAIEQRIVGLDWNSDERVEPPAARPTLAAAAERLRRCAYGAEPKLRTPAWFALRVAAGGKVEAQLASFIEPSAASDCAARVLRSLALPDAGHDYALSLMLLPPLEMGALEDGETGLAANAGRDDWGRGPKRLEAPVGLEDAARGTPAMNDAETLPGKGPKIVLGSVDVRGRLAPEVIRRIVRQRSPQFAACHEAALKRDPHSEGVVSVQFVIGKDGAVSKLRSSSEFKDTTLVQCVERAFEGLTFPTPEAGVVLVTYPVKLYSGKKAIPRPPGINGKPVEQASMTELIAQLERRGLRFVEVPGFAPGQAPAIFVRDQQGLGVAHGAFFGKPSSKPKTIVCTQGTPERTLQLFGEGCAPLLDLIVR
jgi:hypothetical protein